MLLLALTRPSRLAVGKLGVRLLEPGFYLYFGSALGGLWGRVARHLRRQKKRRWHIDYLLVEDPAGGEEARVLEVWYRVSRERLECRWCQMARDLPGARPVPGFGASDCRCGSHLLFYREPPSPETFGVARLCYYAEH